MACAASTEQQLGLGSHSAQLLGCLTWAPDEQQLRQWHARNPGHLQMLEAERKSIRTTIELQVGLLVAWLKLLPPVVCMLLYIPALGCLPQPHLPAHLRTLYTTAAGAGGQQRRADGHRGGGV